MQSLGHIMHSYQSSKQHNNAYQLSKNREIASNNTVFTSHLSKHNPQTIQFKSKVQKFKFIYHPPTLDENSVLNVRK